MSKEKRERLIATTLTRDCKSAQLKQQLRGYYSFNELTLWTGEQMMLYVSLCATAAGC